MEYIKKLPDSPSFRQNGLSGYNFDLDSKDLSITIEDCFKGHDRYYANARSEMIYYVAEGEGIFKINGKENKVKKDDLIEIPKNTEFVFAGKMKLILITSPAFRKEDDINGKENDLYEF